MSKDVIVLMVTLANVIDNYFRHRNPSDIPKTCWLKIIRKLNKMVPEAMSTIESQIPTKLEIRYRGPSGEFIEKTTVRNY
ncbi:hypothetical protein Cantr_08379 [Candida viswanathii]|uniref:Uncharacterized protein n=1 Tax=Candida viswanathii TaxID=5486 RepID=A0A367Y507_9ASCO|nr:hypothetical protein Cantr_08379 [Candida viswanathii]